MRKDKKSGADESVILLRDLAPRKDVKGGAGKILFGEPGAPDEARPEDAAPSSRDDGLDLLQ